MRVPALLLWFFLAGCQPEAEPRPQRQDDAVAPSADPLEPQPPAPIVGGNVSNVDVLTAEPPDDPSLAGMSASQRREYDRGYRDCLKGDYAYDPERQGESYRIGCMAAENAKAGQEH